MTSTAADSLAAKRGDDVVEQIGVVVFRASVRHGFAPKNDHKGLSRCEVVHEHVGAIRESLVVGTAARARRAVLPVTGRNVEAVVSPAGNHLLDGGSLALFGVALRVADNAVGLVGLERWRDQASV